MGALLCKQLQAAPSPAALRLLLALNALWHSMAAFYFCARPRGILRKYLADRNTGIEALRLPTEVMRFLGGINLGFVLVALLALWRLRAFGIAPSAAASPKARASVPTLRGLHADPLWVLAVANFSQFVCDVSAHRRRVASRAMFWQITVPDGMFALLNALFAVRLMLRQPPKPQMDAILSAPR